MRSLLRLVLSVGLLLGVVSVPLQAAPAAPLSLVATIAEEGGIVTLRWLPSPGATGYQVEAGTAYGLRNLATIPVTANTLSGIVPPGHYFVRVRAVSPSGVSEASNEAFFVIWSNWLPPSPSLTIPAAKVTIAATPTGSRIIGLVANYTAHDVASATVRATLWDQFGNALDVVEGAIEGRSRRLVASGVFSQTALPINLTGCFSLTSDVPPWTVHRVSVTSQYTTEATTDVHGHYGFVGLPTFHTFAGRLQVAGRLANLGAVASSRNRIMVYAEHRDGTAADCRGVELEGERVQLPGGVVSTSALRPGHSGAFMVMTDAPYNSPYFRIWQQVDEREAVSVDIRR